MPDQNHKDMPVKLIEPQMEAFLDKHSYLLLGVLAAIATVIAIYLSGKLRDRTGRRSIFDYLLIWPLLLDQHKRRATSKSNKFVISGLIIMFVIVIISMMIHPETK